MIRNFACRGGHHLLIVCALVLPVADAVAETTKIGFIGLRHGHSWGHLQNITGVAEAEFVGVAESIPELVEAAKEIQPDAHYASDYRKFVKEQQPEIVWAFVENNRHLEMVEFLAPLGIHVMFEKPLAGSYRDAVRIQEIAREHGIKVMTNYQMAWLPANHAMRQLTSEGKVGRVWRLHGVVGNGGPSPRNPRTKVFFNWLTDPEANGGGALVDFGIYNAIWAAWHLGLPQSVYASIHQFQPDRFPKVDDNAVLVLSYPHHVGVFESSWNLPRGSRQLEIFGDKGSLFVDRDQLTYRDGRRTPVPVEFGNRDPAESNPVSYIIDRVTRNKPLDHIVALDINVDAVQILEAAKLSGKSGRAVPLPLPRP